MEGKDRYTMTPLGSVLAQLPVDIPIGKMLILGSVIHVLLFFVANISLPGISYSGSYIDYRGIVDSAESLCDSREPQ